MARNSAGLCGLFLGPCCFCVQLTSTGGSKGGSLVWQDFRGKGCNSKGSERRRNKECSHKTILLSPSPYSSVSICRSTDFNRADFRKAASMKV